MNKCNRKGTSPWKLNWIYLSICLY